VPDTAVAVEASITAVAPTGSAGFLRAWPADTTAPTATFLNYLNGQSITNTGAIPIGPTTPGDITIRNFVGTAHYVIDLQGYYATPTT
jgi:hypothetical protein